MSIASPGIGRHTSTKRLEEGLGDGGATAFHLLSSADRAVSDAAADARARLADALIRTGDADRDAFRDVYRLSAAKLFGVCLRICGDRAGAEDVLHDVYLTVWRRAGAFDPARASPITWLATIARNRAIDWRRASGVRRTAPIDDAVEIADNAPSPLEASEASDDARRLNDCLDGLEDRQREVIRIAFFDGATYAEIATMRGVPLGTMKSWVRRGLARLRICLDA